MYQFPYYRNNKGFLRIFLTKALFAIALAYSGAGLFAVVLEMKVEPYAPAVIASIVCLVNFIMLGFFRKLYVAIFDVAAFLLFFAKTPLPMSAQDMLYQIFSVADGNIVRTSGILTQSELQSPVTFFIAVVVVYGALCAFASVQRFRPLGVMTLVAIMIIPAFLGQSLHYSGWLAVLIASILGLWAMTIAASAEAVLSSGHSSNLHMSDYVYLKAGKKLTPAEKLHRDSFHFGRHLSHCFMVFVITLLTLSITASSFPVDGSMRLEDIASFTIDMTKDIGYWFYDLFGGSGLNGFFSADGGDIRISGSIDPEELPTGNRPVAQIITQNTDKLYLKGDVGYSFSGDKWDSVADLDYGRLHYGDGGYSLQYVLDSYAPEVQTYLMRYRMTRAFYEGYDYIKEQTVTVNYLQDINTLLVSGIPYVFNYRSNGNFSVYGDFVAIADRGKVNSIRTAMMYFNDDSQHIGAIMTYRDFHDMSEISSEWDSLPMPMSYDNYEYYIDSYREFVYDYYTDVPAEEADNIAGFLSELYDEEYIGSGEYLGNADMYIRSLFASNINSYLSSSGTFRYALGIDNNAGDNTFLGNFLTDTRAGHCALYATTMCLAMRYLGIPARYVTGFTVGGADEYETVDGGYRYTLLEKDLHAWVEVYYDDVGWIPYDPTPSQGGSSGSGIIPEETTTTFRTTVPPMETSETTERTTPPADTTTTTRPAETTTTLQGGEGGGNATLDPKVIRIILIAVGAVLIALIAALSIAGALKMLRRKEQALISFFRKGDSAKAVAYMFSFTLKILEIRGVQRKSGETPTEFAKRADRTFRAGLGIGLEQAMPLFERAEFDSEPVFNEDERHEVYRTVSKLYEELMLNTKGPNRLITRIRLFGKVKPDRKEK